MKSFFEIFTAALMTVVTLAAALLMSIARAAWGVWPGGKGKRHGDFELVCVSHVPWDGVWQRNQQTMLRLSRTEKVVYVRPVTTRGVAGDPRILIYFFGKKINDRLIVVNPVILWGETRFGWIRKLNRFILISFIRFGMQRTGFTGLPLDLSGGLGESLTVYDIQDEYLTWTTAAKDIGIREQHLLKKADIVFTGTNSLLKKKKKYHRNIHFIQNGVESDHFAAALRQDTVVPEDLKALPDPVIGYFGLIGDRVDISLLERMADGHPEWSIVLIGPVREDTCTVPNKKNIYLLGEKPYQSLPGYLKGFDVAIIPYFMNETTMDLNPTKLLEYFAGGKPVVSTALTDVVELFGDYTYVAHDREEFLTLTEQVIRAPDHSHIEKSIAFARGFTWEAMAGRIRDLLLANLHAVKPGEETHC
jgi:glycosyltransferase involved in cell wall biosynthesis